MHRLRIARGENDLLFDENGRSYIDLFSAHGTAWLGHRNPGVMAALAGQLDRVWVSGGLETAALAEARAEVDSFFPPSHGLAALYSTGMEAAEFALRVARVATGRTGVVGFERSMHGKSLATAFLGWENGGGVRLPGFHRLPFGPGCPEEQTLSLLRAALAGGTVSAVFVEPVQGCGGGHTASGRFYREVARACAEAGSLLVFDEILTGFYRTGDPFVFQTLGLVPDAVLVGKGMGNGFPVAGVVLDRRHPVRPAMLPGSTYAGNPLAAAAVAATLRQVRGADLPAKVARIAETVTEYLRPLARVGVFPRGKGAMWFLDLPAGPDAGELVVRIYQRGVVVGVTGRLLRILPASTIRTDRLAEACDVLRAEVLRSYHAESTGG